MNPETSLFGVYVPSLLLCAALAALAATALALTLRAFGLHRFIWRRSLFNAAAFVCLLGATLQFFSERSP